MNYILIVCNTYWVLAVLAGIQSLTQNLAQLAMEAFREPFGRLTRSIARLSEKVLTV